MSDLDDLAAASQGGGGREPSSLPPQPGAARRVTRRPQAPPMQKETPYSDPHPAAVGVSPKTWVWLSVAVALVLGVAFWLINREPGGTPEAGPIAQAEPRPAAPGSRVPTTAAGLAPADAATAPDTPATAAPKAAAKAATRAAAAGLEDIDDPAGAIEIVRLKRIEGDKVEFTVRNKSNRGVFVRALAFFAETDGRVPLGESITFWTPAGGSIADTREIPEMTRRLGDDEGVTAVVQEAEFSDAMPEELQARARAEDEAGDTDDVDESNSDVDAGPSGKDNAAAE